MCLCGRRSNHASKPTLFFFFFLKKITQRRNCSKHTHTCMTRCFIVFAMFKSQLVVGCDCGMFGLHGKGEVCGVSGMLREKHACHCRAHGKKGRQLSSIAVNQREGRAT
uniref:Uncharacterized protein n=1 Tax=Trypanosoma vivax (strain Y486) TaxID=1055687 RepID=G0U5C2_TRYVY|nr:hypothetical protein, unlikely [Trypanosoma vivax Y486]